MGATPREIADALPAIQLFQSCSEDKALDEKTFDTIALHTSPSICSSLRRCSTA